MKSSKLLVVLLLTGGSNQHHVRHHHHHHRGDDITLQLQAEENAEKLINLKLQLQDTKQQFSQIGAQDHFIHQPEALSLVQKKTKDMGKQMKELIASFTSEAQQNTDKENKQNLKQLKNLKKQIHQTVAATSDIRLEGQKEALRMMGLGDVDLGQPLEPKKEVQNQTPIEVEQEEDIPQTVPVTKQLAKSTNTIKQSDNNDLKEEIDQMQSLNSEGKSFDNLQQQSFDNVQQQMNILEDMLPKITDAGQRAGLVQRFAPKIEQAMAELEAQIEEKKSKHSIIQVSQPNITPIKVAREKQGHIYEMEKKQESTFKLPQPQHQQQQFSESQINEGGNGNGNNFVENSISQAEKIKELEEQINRIDTQTKEIDQLHKQQNIQMQKDEENQKLIRQLKTKVEALEEKEQTQQTKISDLQQLNQQQLSKQQQNDDKKQYQEKVQKDQDQDQVSEEDQAKINKVKNIAQDIHSFVQQIKNSNISNNLQQQDEKEEPEEEEHVQTKKQNIPSMHDDQKSSKSAHDSFTRQISSNSQKGTQGSIDLLQIHSK